MNAIVMPIVIVHKIAKQESACDLSVQDVVFGAKNAHLKIKDTLFSVQILYLGRVIKEEVVF